LSDRVDASRERSVYSNALREIPRISATTATSHRIATQ
jgi:hypothetical protein